MRSMSAPRQYAPEIGQKPASHTTRHSGAHDDAPFGKAVLGGFEIDPADQSNNFLADLDADALNEVTIDHFGLAHSRLRNGVSHHVLQSGRAA